MAEPTVLRFPIAGNPTEYFLLEVASDGSSPLDLMLKGSEGSAAFALKLRQKRIGRHKASAGHCSDEDWEDILMSTLVDQKPPHDIQTRVEIQSEKNSTTANLVFRKNIQGITQRLGTLSIEEKDVEILPFNWCVSAIGAQDKLRQELAATTAKVQKLEGAANELKSQLKDLINAKEEDEAVMLEKFCTLLNEKKLKIRQQQSLLATANFESNMPDDVKSEEEEDQGLLARPSKPPRAPKRKASKPLGGQDETDDGYVKMEVDEDEMILDNLAEADADDMDQEQRQTTDEDTESEAVSEEEEEEAPPAPATRKGRSTRGKAATTSAASGSSSKTKQKGKAKVTRAAPAPESDDDMDEPPPPRSLPFMKKKGTAITPAPKPADDEDDDDATESDDEL